MNHQSYFRARLILYSAIILMPLLAVLGYNAHKSFGESETKALQAVENYSLLVAHEVEALLSRSERSLSQLATRPAVLALDAKHCDPWLKEFIDFAPEYANLGVISLAGVPVCLSTSAPGRVPRSFAGFDWFRHAMQVDGFATSAPFLGPITLKQVSVFSYPLRNTRGQRIGTLALPLELGRLTDFWKSFSLPPGSVIAVFDSEGVFMARFPHPEQWVGKRARAVLDAALQAAPSGVGVGLGMDGVERAFALKTLPKFGWQVVVGIPAAAVFRSDSEAGTRSLAVTGAVLLFVLLLVTTLSRRLSTPLHDLAASVRAVAGGDFSARANEAVAGEFRELAQQFNRMLRLREQAQNELRESEERFRDLANLSSDWFWEQDADLRFTTMSDDLYPKTHFRPSSTIGKLRWELPIVGVSEEQWRAHRELLDRREPFADFVYQLVNEAGEVRWFSINGKPLFAPDGAFRGYRGTGKDITPRRRAEEEIRKLNENLEQKVRERTRELERSNAELESFSYSVAHDLRTPLRGINGFSAILASEYAGKLDAVARDYLRRIQTATVRMGEVMDDLLALAHAGRAELRRQQVDLSAMAHAVAVALKATDAQREVGFDIAPGVVAEVDPGLMRIALDNLLGNAWKFTAKRAAATIEFGFTTVEGRRAYFVRDNGAGFDPAFSGKLFRQFQRLHTHKEYEGTGMGLAIVASVVRRHGGQVWAEGALGQGAVFYFTLDQQPG